MYTLTRSWTLFKQSFTVLSEEPSLMVFPVLSFLSAVALFASFFVPLYRIGTLDAIRHHRATWMDFLPLFSWYYANTFVVVFFNSALTACVNIRLSGGNPRLSDGLRIACGHLHRIAGWALLSATVGLILNGVESRSRRAGKFAAAILGAGWTLITYLIVPVVIIENCGLIDSVKRSVALLRKTWGEQVVGGLGFGFLGVLLFLPGIVLGIAVGSWDRTAGVIVMAIYILMMAAIHASVTGIFRVALYRFAADGQAPGGFSTEALVGGYRRPDTSAW